MLGRKRTKSSLSHRRECTLKSLGSIDECTWQKLLWGKESPTSWNKCDSVRELATPPPSFPTFRVTTHPPPPGNSLNSAVGFLITPWNFLHLKQMKKERREASEIWPSSAGSNFNTAFYLCLKINASRCGTFVVRCQQKNDVKFKILSQPWPLVGHDTADTTRLLALLQSQHVSAPVDFVFPNWNKTNRSG